VTEKQTIIEEVFTKIRKYIDENVEMKIETVKDIDYILEECPKCRNELDDLYWRSDHVKNSFFLAIDLALLYCKDCKLYFAYWIDEPTWDPLVDEIPEDEDSAKQTYPLKESADPKRINKKCRTVYSKSLQDTKERTKQIELLIQTKLPQLYEAGLSISTINFAKNKVIRYLNKEKPTPTAPSKLIAGAIYATANGVTSDGSCLRQHQGEGITEEKLEMIFGVTRKTIRRWAKTLS
jgi:hypothetical protein